jgi:arginyl-tRNA synthetase
MLDDVVNDLNTKGLLVESNGALCVFPPGFQNREGEPLPLIVRKSDEGYGYAATDLAAIRDRVGNIGANEILYVVGAPQSQHLEMCFAVARLAKWLPEECAAVHVAFGSVLGADHKMLRSRSGESVRLVDLLDEAIDRARTAIASRASVHDRDALDDAARTIGIGAVKYADLSTERTRDYVFDWDRMLASEGNTAPYLQYAYARIRSVFRRSDGVAPSPVVPVLGHAYERSLAVQLLGFPSSLDQAVRSYLPNRLCVYLFDLATSFTAFYENCPILKAPTTELRSSRLFLAELTARVLRQGLELLGIGVLEQM